MYLFYLLIGKSGLKRTGISFIADNISSLPCRYCWACDFQGFKVSWGKVHTINR